MERCTGLANSRVRCDYLLRPSWTCVSFPRIVHTSCADLLHRILHGASAAVSPLAIGTILYNVVDSAVGMLPVTFVDAEKDKLTDEWRKLDIAGSKLIEDRFVASYFLAFSQTDRIGVECTEREERTISTKSSDCRSEYRSLALRGRRRSCSRLWS